MVWARDAFAASARMTRATPTAFASISFSPLVVLHSPASGVFCANSMPAAGRRANPFLPRISCATIRPVRIKGDWMPKVAVVGAGAGGAAAVAELTAAGHEVRFWGRSQQTIAPFQVQGGI